MKENAGQLQNWSSNELRLHRTLWTTSLIYPALKSINCVFLRFLFSDFHLCCILFFDFHLWFSSLISISDLHLCCKSSNLSFLQSYLATLFRYSDQCRDLESKSRNYTYFLLQILGSGTILTLYGRFSGILDHNIEGIEGMCLSYEDPGYHGKPAKRQYL